MREITSVVQWIHLVAAVAAVGGMVFMLFILMPSLRVLGDEPRALLVRKVHERFRWVGWGAILLLIGSGLFMPKIDGKALRSMKAPGTAYDDPVLGKDPQPATMKDYVETTSDNGGVHINSGIPNHAFYLAAAEIGGHSWTKAGKIWYIALRDRLRSGTNFEGAAYATISVAKDLYGSGSKEMKAVRKAWKAVGVI